MPYYSKNAGLIGPGAQSSRVGVHDLDLARLHPISTSVIPTQNLHSHWDLSLLSDPVGTTYTANGVAIPGSSGTSIGVAPSTPGLTHYFTSTQNSTTISQTTGGKKYLSFASGGGSNTGSVIVSNGNGFPNFTSSGYSWIGVFKYGSTPSNYLPPYTWYMDGYGGNSSYNHGRFWVYPSSGGELDIINYSSSQLYAIISSPAPLSIRGQTNQLIVDVVSVIGQTGYVASCIASSTPTTGSFNFSAVTYSTQGDANRVFKIFENFYSTTRPAFNAYEFAFYSAPLDAATRESTATALYNKWSA
jgi:hypothetical protein